MSRILLTGLRVAARIGWTADERATPQPLVLDLDVTVVEHPAGGPDADAPAVGDGAAGGGAVDDLAGTVDYAALAATVADLVAGSSRRLLETLAADVLAEVLRDRRVDAATVTVHKPAAPLPVRVDDVAVVVSGRADPDRAGPAPARPAAPAVPAPPDPVRAVRPVQSSPAAAGEPEGGRDGVAEPDVE